VIYLTPPELLHVVERVLGPELVVCDHGLLESALARPRTTVFGEDAYATLETKAVALLHPVVKDHALVDGTSACRWPPPSPSSACTASD